MEFINLLVIVLILYLIYHEIRENFIHTTDVCLKKVVNDVAKYFPFVTTLKFYTGESSYTLNKKRIYICVKDENGNYYTKEQLTVVVLHELAHAMNDEIGHGEKFQRIFESLLGKATNVGLIDSTTEVPSNYCGIDQ